MEVERLATDVSIIAIISSYSGCDTAEVRTAGVAVGIGSGLVGVVPRKLFASCFFARALDS